MDEHDLASGWPGAARAERAQLDSRTPDRHMSISAVARSS